MNKKYQDRYDSTTFPKEYGNLIRKIKKMPLDILNQLINPSENREYKVGLVIPDIHYPFHDKATISIAKQLATDLQPDHLILLGDCFDANDISKYTKKTVEQGIYNTLEEMQGFREDVFLPLIESCNNDDLDIKWCGGNHDEQRIRDVIEDMPERAKILDLHKMFPEADICQYNEMHKIGKLYFTHGEWCNDAHAKSHVLAYGANIVYGHTHTIQTYTMTTKGAGKSHKGTSLGCACNLSPAYMKNKAHKWQLALGIVYFYPNGDYNLYTIEIIKGQAIFNNKVYIGNE